FHLRNAVAGSRGKEGIVLVGTARRSLPVASHDAARWRKRPPERLQDCGGLGEAMTPALNLAPAFFREYGSRLVPFDSRRRANAIRRSGSRLSAGALQDF